MHNPKPPSKCCYPLSKGGRLLLTLALVLCASTTFVAAAQAPRGSDKTVTTFENQPYVLLNSDYGFSDPNDTPPNNFSRLKITSLPSAGALSHHGTPINAGDILGVAAEPGGATWTSQAGPGVRDWVSLASSADGAKLVAGAWGDYLYTSTDSGVSWTTRLTDAARGFYSLASSADGTKLIGGTRYDFLFTSSDSGVTWTARESKRYWRGVASSSDGTKLIAADGDPGSIYTSGDSGASWTARTGPGNREWTSVASSADGTKLVAVGRSAQIYTSTDSGASWTARASARDWQGVASSSDGTKLAAAALGGQIYTSVDSGATWTARESDRNWLSVSSSANGNVLLAADSGGKLYVSTDSGVSWTPRDNNRIWRGVTMSADGSTMAAGLGGGANAGTIYTSVGTPIPLVFTPAISSSGSPYASFTFQVQDDGGSANGGTDLDGTPRTMTINVTPLNVAPVFVGSINTLNISANSGPVDVGALLRVNDPDSGQVLSWSQSIPANHGGLNIVAANAPSGNDDITPGGLIGYTPAPGYVGPDTFAVQVTDGFATVTRSISVNVFNLAPTAVADTATINEDNTLSVPPPGVLVNDTDANGDLLQAILITGTVHGQLTLQPTGGFSYTPEANYNGPDSFRYKANDGRADSGIVTVTITVTAVNDAPVVQAPLPNQSGTYGTFFIATIPSTAFSDADDGQVLNYSAAGLPPGIVFDAATGTLSGRPTLAGTFVAQIRATDNGTPMNLSATASFTFAVRKAALAVTTDDQIRSYGAANPLFTGTLSGVQNSDSISASFASSATAGSPIGAYSIVPTLLDPAGKLSNYEVVSNNGTLQISPVPLWATANDAARDYGQDNPSLTGVLTGVVNQDEIVALYNTGATPASSVGTYSIGVSFFDPENNLPNYTVTTKNGTLTVRNLAPVVNAGPDQEVVAGDEVNFAGSFTDPSSPTHTIVWSFGDAPPMTDSLTPTHTYRIHRRYTVTLTVTDSHGAVGSDTMIVNVISSRGLLKESGMNLAAFGSESRDLSKVALNIAGIVGSMTWLDEMHLRPDEGHKIFADLKTAAQDLQKVLRDAAKKGGLSAVATQAAQTTLSDVLDAAMFVAETAYLETLGWIPADSKDQKKLDQLRAQSKTALDEGKVDAAAGNADNAIQKYRESWEKAQAALKFFPPE